jgi:ABC-type metal ion transport system substrate-binding protein
MFQVHKKFAACGSAYRGHWYCLAINSECSSKQPNATVPHAQILEFVRPTLAKEGVGLDIKVFTDFIQPAQGPEQHPGDPTGHR